MHVALKNLHLAQSFSLGAALPAFSVSSLALPEVHELQSRTAQAAQR